MVEHCLVHWVNEDRWDVFPINRLPGEHRHEGALAMLPWGPNDQQFLGKVVKISSNLKTVEKAEQKLSKEIKEKQSVVNRKRKSVPTNRTGSTASDAQVSKALGERKKLSSAQAQQKKDVASAKRLKTKAQEEAEQDDDNDLLGISVARQLNFDKTAQPLSSNQVKPVRVHDILSDEEGTCSEAGDEEADGDEVDDLQLSNDDNDDADEDDAAGAPTLNDFKNLNTVAFLEYLLDAFTPTKARQSVSSESKEFAKPVSDEKQKMVHLKKGYALMVPKGAKAKLLVDSKSRKSPTVFLRKTLSEIYGAAQLGQMTAKGRCDGSIGISDSDLAAIYSFVTEYSEGCLEWPRFISTINKKCSSHKSPSSTKKTSSKDAKAQSSAENLVVTSSSKQMATQLTPGKHGHLTPQKSPLKPGPAVCSPRKSPWKVTATQPSVPVEAQYYQPYNQYQQYQQYQQYPPYQNYQNYQYQQYSYQGGPPLPPQPAPQQQEWTQL